MSRKKLKSPFFRFKYFTVDHSKSAMKVGVDSVLLGAWADICGCRRILDIGTGCGLLALMMAQRCPEASIDAVEIDSVAAQEAAENFLTSPWGERLRIFNTSFEEFLEFSLSKKIDANRYDLLISNPPYFESGISNPTSAREIARHQGTLSPYSILTAAPLLLNKSGTVAMVLPITMEKEVSEHARKSGLSLTRLCRVRGHAAIPVKRILMEFRTASRNSTPEEIELILEESPGEPTMEHRLLCRDFYLKF